MKYKAISKFCNNERNYFVLPAVSKVIYREWFNDGLLKTRLSVHCAPTQRLHFAEGSGWIYIVSMGIVGSINGRKRVDLRFGARHHLRWRLARRNDDFAPAPSDR